MGEGDYTRTHNLMSRLPQLPGEQTPIYVLTGSMTFSAGISSVAFLKASGDEQVIIAGTQMGDYERMWGETTSMGLPNSRLGMSLATGLHDYANGCYEFPNCYWLDFFYNVAVGSLSPDVYIPYTFEDYLQGKDAAVEYVSLACIVISRTRQAAHSYSLSRSPRTSCFPFDNKL